MSMTNQGDAKGRTVVSFYRVEVMQEVYSRVETEEHPNLIQMKKMLKIYQSMPSLGRGGCMQMILKIK